MKLDGWKRIGILASVVWIVGAGLYTHGTTEESDIKTASAIGLNSEN